MLDLSETFSLDGSQESGSAFEAVGVPVVS